MASLPALAPLPMAIKRQLCEKMVFALVPTKGTTIMQNGERIDAWLVNSQYTDVGLSYSKFHVGE
jgi:hypothetical protein